MSGSNKINHAPCVEIVSVNEEKFVYNGFNEVQFDGFKLSDQKRRNFAGKERLSKQ